MQLIFKSWTTHTLGGYIASLLAVVAFACLQEVLRLCGAHYETKLRRAKRAIARQDLEEALVAGETGEAGSSTLMLACTLYIIAGSVLTGIAQVCSTCSTFYTWEHTSSICSSL